MKILLTIACISTVLLASSPRPETTFSISEIRGAWHLKNNTGEQLLIIEDNYCSITSYDQQKKRFYFTKGGVLTGDDNVLSLKMEFHSAKPTEVGKTLKGSYSVKADQLQTRIDGEQLTWTRVDNSQTPLTGCWRINGRVNNGRMNEMRPGPRKTLKILSGTKFQWMAINTETKEFMGTGGGTYTFKDGAYTEYIEFFSRDSSRVGASLTFEGKVESGAWFHKGKSSTGNPVDERWVKH